MKSILIMLIFFTFANAAKSFKIIDNRSGLPVSLATVERISDGARTLSDSLGFFNFDFINTTSIKSKNALKLKWFDASGKNVSQPNHLKKRSYSIKSNSKQTTLESHKKIQLGYLINKNGYEILTWKPQILDSIAILNKITLSDSTIIMELANDVYKRKILSREKYYKVNKILEQEVWHAISNNSDKLDSLINFQRSESNSSNLTDSLVKINLLNPLFDSIWSNGNDTLNYKLKGDTSVTCLSSSIIKVLTYDYLPKTSSSLIISSDTDCLRDVPLVLDYSNIIFDLQTTLKRWWIQKNKFLDYFSFYDSLPNTTMQTNFHPLVGANYLTVEMYDKSEHMFSLAINAELDSCFRDHVVSSYISIDSNRTRVNRVEQSSSCHEAKEYYWPLLE